MCSDELIERGGSGVLSTMAELVAIASEMVNACVVQDWARAYRHADPKFARGVTEFVSAETWRRVRALAGNLVRIANAYEFRHLLAPIRVVFLDCEFERMVVVIEVNFGEDDKILGLAMRTPGFA